MSEHKMRYSCRHANQCACNKVTTHIHQQHHHHVSDSAKLCTPIHTHQRVLLHTTIDCTAIIIVAVWLLATTASAAAAGHAVAVVAVAAGRRLRRNVIVVLADAVVVYHVCCCCCCCCVAVVVVDVAHIGHGRRTIRIVLSVP